MKSAIKVYYILCWLLKMKCAVLLVHLQGRSEESHYVMMYGVKSFAAYCNDRQF